MMKLQNTTKDISEREIILWEKDGMLYPDDTITVEQFVTMIIRSSKGCFEPNLSGWSSGYMEYALRQGIIEDCDMTNRGKPIERRSAARIVHEVLLTELGERDEMSWSAAENLIDLYSCHTCVIHIAQMYVKGIMLCKEKEVFDVLGNITWAEAAAIVGRMLDREQRIPQTEDKKLIITNMTPDEAWELMLKDSTAKLIDVRTIEEYNVMHIEGSICIPLRNIVNNPFSVCDKKNTPIILYCQKGYKSSAAAQVLIDAGYSRIYTIPGIELNNTAETNWG